MAIRQFIRGIFRAIPILFLDLMGLAGVSLITWGARLIYEPAGYIVGGGFLLLIALRLGQRG